MFSTETIAALAVGGVLAILIPVIAVIVFKRKYRDSWLPSAFIGAGTFVLFALILEQILHTVMIPILKDNIIIYSIYGALAAGVFEETGRFVAYKTLMKKRLSTKNAVLMGLGHGGIEAIIALGITLLAFLVLAVMSNSMGIDKVLEISANVDSEAALKTQLEGLKEYNFMSCAMGVYERIIAMVCHTCLSVFVYKAITQKGKIWLYPTAILLHALVDLSAALYQVNVITSIAVVYIFLTVSTVIIAGAAVLMAKKLKD